MEIPEERKCEEGMNGEEWHRSDNAIPSVNTEQRTGVVVPDVGL